MTIVKYHVPSDVPLITLAHSCQWQDAVVECASTDARRPQRGWLCKPFTSPLTPGDHLGLGDGHSGQGDVGQERLGVDPDSVARFILDVVPQRLEVGARARPQRLGRAPPRSAATPLLAPQPTASAHPTRPHTPRPKLFA